jgi:hypothetical protein
MTLTIEGLAGYRRKGDVLSVEYQGGKRRKMGRLTSRLGIVEDLVKSLVEERLGEMSLKDGSSQLQGRDRQETGK